MEYEHQYDLAKLSLKNIANTQVCWRKMFVLRILLVINCATYDRGFPMPVRVAGASAKNISSASEHFLKCEGRGACMTLTHALPRGTFCPVFTWG